MCFDFVKQEQRKALCEKLSYIKPLGKYKKEMSHLDFYSNIGTGGTGAQSIVTSLSKRDSFYGARVSIRQDKILCSLIFHYLAKVNSFHSFFAYSGFCLDTVYEMNK